jgi:hypothetical protein
MEVSTPSSVQERQSKSELLFYSVDGGSRLSINVIIRLTIHVKEYKNRHLVLFPYHVIGAEFQIISHTEVCG